VDTRPSELPAYRRFREPQLLFHPERQQDHHVHPLKGLHEFGPYSRSLVNHVLDPIRLAMIAPDGELDVLEGILKELEGRHQPQERRQYLIDFPGFSRVFGLRVVAGPASARVALPADLDARLEQAERPHLVLAEAITRAITRVAAQRHDFDVLLIYLPDRWAVGFVGGPDEDFDLHDYLKATTASRGIPSQILREDKALSYPCRASVTWRLGIALYCKAGGIPWKLANTPAQAAYVGLSYALRTTSSGQSRFVTCCSQVFDADGSGLEFLEYDTDDARLDRENPYLSRAAMRRVMARSLELYQRQHAGQTPKQLVVHKTTEFKPEEIDGCFDAWPAGQGLELVQVQDDVAWRGVQIDPPRVPGDKGTPAPYPCQRGIALQLGGREILLWTQGNAPAAVGGQNFFKEGKGIPSPLLLRRFAGHGALDETCKAVLGLSKMDWNNDGLYDRLPVTLGYARVLARTVRRIPALAATPYQFRLFM
jgi:hypothetical protein